MTTTDETALAAGPPKSAFAPAPRGAADDLVAGTTAAGVSMTTAPAPADAGAPGAAGRRAARPVRNNDRLAAAVDDTVDAAVDTAPATPAVASGEAGGGSVLDDTLARAVGHLKSLQDEAGWWKGDLETNTTMDAEDLMLRHWLGIWDQERARSTARYIRSKQLPDGSWPIYHAGPGDLAVTIESYVALRLVGDGPDEPHMRAAAAWARAHGGVPAVRIFTKIWFTLMGWWRWEDLPVLPPELIFLPSRMPLSIYRFGSWARQTIVAIMVLMAYRPTGEQPFSIAELFPAPAPGKKKPRRGAGQPDWQSASLDDLLADEAAGTLRPPAVLATPPKPAAKASRRAKSARALPDVMGRAKDGGGPGLPAPAKRLARLRFHTGQALKNAALDHVSWSALFRGIDKALHVYHRHAIRPVRALALNLAERWIIVRQEADGCFGGIQPPTVYSIIALRLLGYPMDHPVITAALRSLDDYSVTRPDGARMTEACQSPVWDTCLATIALADAGVPRDDPALVQAADWMLGQEVTARRGDWSVPIPDVPTGGWAFEFENDTYPDVDDSAEVMLALMRVTHPRPDKVIAATYRGLQWVFGMQCADGGWGAFDVDNAGDLVYKIPFADFGMLTDPPSADVTAHVVELLGELGLGDDPRTKRGVEWLLHSQEADGSWYGRWGVNHLYGTGGVVPALRAAGLPASHPAIQRAADWLVARQNPDGGWGESCYSYDDMATAGVGVSTASQTAWALLALIAAGRVGDGARGEAAARGVAWLASTQTAEGTWDEDSYTGTGFAGYFYINYHLYRLVWPVMALGRYQRALAENAH